MFFTANSSTTVTCPLESTSWATGTFLGEVTMAQGLWGKFLILKKNLLGQLMRSKGEMHLSLNLSLILFGKFILLCLKPSRKNLKLPFNFVHKCVYLIAWSLVDIAWCYFINQLVNNIKQTSAVLVTQISDIQSVFRQYLNRNNLFLAKSTLWKISE